MGAEKSKLAKGTGYSSEAMQMYEDLYTHATRNKKEPFTASTLHFRLRIDLDTAIALTRLFDRDRDGAVSFADLVLGYYACGAAPIDDKCDAVVRLYDVHGDGFLTQENLLQISDDIGGILSLDNLAEEVITLSSNLESAVGAPPLDMAALLARVAARTGNNGSNSGAHSSTSGSAAAKHSRKSKKRSNGSNVSSGGKRAVNADDSESGESDTPPIATGTVAAAAGAVGSGASASTATASVTVGSAASNGKDSSIGVAIKDTQKDAPAPSSKKDKANKSGSQVSETVRIRSLRQRLTIALALYEKALEFDGAPLRDVQRAIITELLARHGIEQFVPVVAPAWDDGVHTDALSPPPAPATPPIDDRGRALHHSSSLAVPTSATTTEGLRTRSRSPLKKGKRDDVPAVTVTSVSSSTTTVVAPSPVAANGSSSNGTTNNSSSVTATSNGHHNGLATAETPRKMMLQLGVPANVLREQAKLNPALLFALLHFRKFTQATLLEARPRERRPHDFDYFGANYAASRPPIVIDLSNLAKTERDLVRRRQSDEQMLREKQKREMKELDAMRRSGSNGSTSGSAGGGMSGVIGIGGSDGSGIRGGSASASGLTSNKKSQPSSASGNNGGSGSSNNAANNGSSSSLSGMAALSMTGSAAALFSR